MAQTVNFTIDGNRFHDRITVRNEFWAVLTTLVLEHTNKTINLDAFNDILWGGFGKFEGREPIQLTWKNSEKSKQDLGYPETVRYLNEKLQDCHPSNRSFVQAEIEAAQAETGPTLFDIIIKIIQINIHVQLVLE